MKTLTNSLHKLRVPLAVLAFWLACGATAVILTDRNLDVARQRTEQHERQLRDARLRLQKSGEEKAVILRYLPEYQALQKQGFIGAEQRINWLDGLRTANSGTGLYGVEYQIGAQQPYANQTETSSLPFQQSLMKVKFRLLHEEDLMGFFSALNDQRVGTFALNECLIERMDAEAVMANPSLRAECELAWITLNAEAIKP